MFRADEFCGGGHKSRLSLKMKAGAVGMRRQTCGQGQMVTKIVHNEHVAWAKFGVIFPYAVKSF